MAISIINNSTAIAAQSSVNNASNSLSKTLRSLSTGLKINSASDMVQRIRELAVAMHAQANKIPNYAMALLS